VGSEDGFARRRAHDRQRHSTSNVRLNRASDGGGLYLIVAGPTSKNWAYRYWKDGKERWHGLGSFKDVSLKDARLARDAARLRVKGDRSNPGVDIVQERRQSVVRPRPSRTPRDSPAARQP